jgi:hypothetical protein
VNGTEGELLLRPTLDAPRARRLRRVAAPLALLTITAASVLAAILPSPATVTFLLVVLVDYVALPWLYLRNSSVFVRDGWVGKTDMWARTTAIPVAEIRAMVHARPYVRTTVVQLLDAQRRVVLKLYPTAYRDDQMAALRSRLNLEGSGGER